MVKSVNYSAPCKLQKRHVALFEISLSHFLRNHIEKTNMVHFKTSVLDDTRKLNEIQKELQKIKGPEGQLKASKVQAKSRLREET